MTLLKIKSKLFQYTGIFLAYKEQSKYNDSKEYWEDFDNNTAQQKGSLSSRNIHGILIGSWQARNGFHRMCDVKYWSNKKSNAFLATYSWLRVFYWTLKSDIKCILSKKKYEKNKESKERKKRS